MPVLADIRKTQEELSLALAELDNIEAAVNGIDTTRNATNTAAVAASDNTHLRDRVDFLSEENRELAQVLHLDRINP